MKTFVEIRWHVLGMHHYPGAPDAVAFLRNPHRHIFHMRAKVAVGHNNRDVEFILLKRDCLAFNIANCKGTALNAAQHEALEWCKFNKEAWLFDFGSLSCEQIASEIFLHLSGLGYDVRVVGCGEDGEFEATVEA